MIKVKVDHTYHVVELNELTTGLVDWLNFTFGPPGPRWWISNYSVYFESGSDHLMFLLRWSS